jgi:hypothetical protein
VRQGRQYAEEAQNFREKIASLAIGFIKDDSVVSIGALMDEAIFGLKV